MPAQREFITQYLDVGMQYEEILGLDIPYGKDIILFFPEGDFEYRIADRANTFIHKSVSNPSQNIIQVNISFLQYIVISQQPRLYVRSLKERPEGKMMVVFTTL